MYSFLKNWFVPVYDDAEDKTAEAKAAAEERAAEEAKAAEDSAAGRKFTQDQVNEFLAKEKNKQKATYDKRIKTLENIRDNNQLTSGEVDRLNQEILDMQNEFKTKEQLATEDATKKQKAYEKDLKTSKDETTLWQDRYTNMVVENSIINASVNNEAFQPEQIVALLKGNTRLVDSLDEDGKRTGNLEPKTKFIGVDEDNKELELDIKPSEAVKRMSTMDKYANLFKGAATSGLGAQNTNRGTGKLGDLRDTNNYMKQRKKMGLGKVR